MHTNVKATRILKELLKPIHIIFDVLYNPPETKLIQDLEEADYKTISIVNILVHQDAQSLRIWLGVGRPTKTIKEIYF